MGFSYVIEVLWVCNAVEANGKVLRNAENCTHKELFSRLALVFLVVRKITQPTSKNCLNYYMILYGCFFVKDEFKNLYLEVCRFLFVISYYPTQSFVLGQQKQCCVSESRLESAGTKVEIKTLSHDQQIYQKNKPSEQSVQKVGQVHINDVGAEETIHQVQLSPAELHYQVSPIEMTCTNRGSLARSNTCPILVWSTYVLCSSL